MINFFYLIIGSRCTALDGNEQVALHALTRYGSRSELHTARHTKCFLFYLYTKQATFN